MIILVMLPNSPVLLAQDSEASQIYSVPMHLNPAFTGSSDFSSAYLNYRIQYPEINYPFVSARFAIDYSFHKIPSGVGLIMSYDRSGPGDLRKTSVGALYSYYFNINRDWEVRAGAKAEAVFQSTNFSNYIFGDQISANGTYQGTSQEGLSGSETIIYPDFQLGAVMHNDAAWFGIAVDHIAQPNQSFMDGDSRLPRKYSLHAGYRFGFINANGRVQKGLKEFSITPMALLWMQSSFKRLAHGAEFVYEPLMVGFWYRGLPLGTNPAGTGNQDALVFLLGFYTQGFTIGYSYDYTISTLARNSGGAHEISVAVDFGFYTMGKKSSYRKRWPNPRF